MAKLYVSTRYGTGITTEDKYVDPELSSDQKLIYQLKAEVAHLKTRLEETRDSTRCAILSMSQLMRVTGEKTKDPDTKKRIELLFTHGIEK